MAYAENPGEPGTVEEGEGVFDFVVQLAVCGSECCAIVSRCKFEFNDKSLRSEEKTVLNGSQGISFFFLFELHNN